MRLMITQEEAECNDSLLPFSPSCCCWWKTRRTDSGRKIRKCHSGLIK